MAGRIGSGLLCPIDTYDDEIGSTSGPLLGPPLVTTQRQLINQHPNADDADSSLRVIVQ
jgi:hypothetical protein